MCKTEFIPSYFTSQKFCETPIPQDFEYRAFFISGRFIQDSKFFIPSHLVEEHLQTCVFQKIYRFLLTKLHLLGQNWS